LLGRLGLLAVACGDGNIYIYSVPEPDELAARFQSVSTGNEFNRQTRRLIVQLSPTVKISDMFNNQYLWCLQWSNDLVHSYLLTATVTEKTEQKNHQTRPENGKSLNFDRTHLQSRQFPGHQ